MYGLKRGSICTKLDCIYNQLDSLETRQKTLEYDIDIRSSTASSSTSITPSSIGKCKRATPLSYKYCSHTHIDNLFSCYDPKNNNPLYLFLNNRTKYNQCIMKWMRTKNSRLMNCKLFVVTLM